MYKPKPIKPPPGIIRNGTIDQLAGRWIDSDMIRFSSGSVIPVSGWALVTGDSTVLENETPVRNILSWRGPTNIRYHSLGTSAKLFVQSGSYSHDNIADITPDGFLSGKSSGTFTSGYGSGPYGRGAYGSDYQEEDPGAITPIEHATIWHLAIRRNSLYAVSTHDQKLYRWDPPDEGTKAAQVENSPEGVLAMCVTAHHQIMTVGDGANLNAIRWSDGVDDTVWTPDPRNNAGFLEYPLIGVPIKLVPFGQDVMLFTSSALYRLTYYGASVGYGVSRVAEGCAPIGPNAIVFHTDQVVWMGRGEFYMYNGGAVVTLPSDLLNFVYADINMLQAYKIHAAIITTHNEVWWWIVSLSSSEPDKYVFYDYEQQVWGMGTGMLRTAWSNPGIYDNPLAVGVDNKLYIQEKGNIAGLRNMKSFITLNLPSIPGRATKTDFLVHDIIGSGNSYPEVNVTLQGSNGPSNQYKRLSSKKVDRDGKTKLRGNAHRLTLRFDIESWSDWRLGSGTLYVKPGAKRQKIQETNPIGSLVTPVPIKPSFVTGYPNISDIKFDRATFNIQADIVCSFTIKVDGREIGGTLQARVALPVEVDGFDELTEYPVEIILYNTDFPDERSVAYLSFATTSRVPVVSDMEWGDIENGSATLQFTTNVPSNVQGAYRVHILVLPVYPDDVTSEVIYESPASASGMVAIPCGTTGINDQTAIQSGVILVSGRSGYYLEYVDQGDGFENSSYDPPTLNAGGNAPVAEAVDVLWKDIQQHQATLQVAMSGYLDRQYYTVEGVGGALIFNRSTTGPHEIVVDRLDPGRTYDNGTLRAANLYGDHLSLLPPLTTLP